ncbi:hypothetical protein GCM10010191_01720 [Actinomadura vinacea]|uniref:Uncharacterized protein n=1 Tax=Actinomadura vinacea TaxID=115336 RepID=A0ABN3IAQ6_9ACTN
MDEAEVSEQIWRDELRGRGSRAGPEALVRLIEYDADPFEVEPTAVAGFLSQVVGAAPLPARPGRVAAIVSIGPRATSTCTSTVRPSYEACRAHKRIRPACTWASSILDISLTRLREMCLM